MAIDFPDKLRSTRADGLLVDRAAVDGAGLPTYIADTTYDAAANTLTGTIPGIAALPRPCQIMMVTPLSLDRKASRLMLTIGGVSTVLRGFDRTSLFARDLTPVRVIPLVLPSSGDFIILEPLPPRPQDFAVHLFYFTPTNSADTGAPDFEDPAFTLTQAAIDGATFHTMSTTTSPRVSWPTGYTPTRTVASDEDDAYDDRFPFFSYYAVPADAPNIRGVGLGRSTNYPGESTPRGWRGTLGAVLPEHRVSGTFNIGGVAHKFVRFTEVITPAEEDPPTTWESLYRGTPYSVIAFEGHPDPPITT